MPSIRDFAVWEPLLRYLRSGNADDVGGQVSGRIDLAGLEWNWPGGWRRPSGNASDAVRRVRGALADAGLPGIRYTAEFLPGDRVVLHLSGLGPAVEPGASGGLEIVLVGDSVPAPWRRSPDLVPGAAPAPSVDLALLERTLRGWFPGAVGATEEEVAAAERRLGVALPDELKVLYRVTGAPREGYQDYAEPEQFFAEGVGYYSFPYPFSLDDLYLATASTRPCPWQFAAREAAVTPADAAVQGLAGSPGWIAFGDSDGDLLAVDLTPGPRGHTGQVIMISRYANVGAELLADSLTSLVTRRGTTSSPSPGGAESPVVARASTGEPGSVQAAAHPDLEVLCIDAGEGDPLSLGPVLGLPRLRTLAAAAGTLADPLEVASLTGLEFLELGPEEWRILLDAGGVPGSLLAGAIQAPGVSVSVTAIATELLGLWGRPPVTQMAIEGHLGHPGR